MSGLNVKFWENQTPPQEYYEDPNPYQSIQKTRKNLPIIDHLKLSRYVIEHGRNISDLSHEEMQQFIVAR